jgi:hypothetical protein
MALITAILLNAMLGAIVLATTSVEADEESEAPVETSSSLVRAPGIKSSITSAVTPQRQNSPPGKPVPEKSSYTAGVCC